MLPIATMNENVITCTIFYLQNIVRLNYMERANNMITMLLVLCHFGCFYMDLYTKTVFDRNLYTAVNL